MDANKPALAHGISRQPLRMTRRKSRFLPLRESRGVMDEAFACPECGTNVQVQGIAPGRQVRCGFCHRLVEVPYLPRAVDPGWRRQRFGRPWWVPWAWAS